MDAVEPEAEAAPVRRPSIYYDPAVAANAPIKPPPAAAPPRSADASSDAIVQEELARPTFTTPSVPSIENPGNDDVLDSPPETEEIPQAIPDDDQVAMLPASATGSSMKLTSYSTADPSLPDGMGSLRDFVTESEETSPIGFEVRETRCRLKTGEELSGLLILKVEKDSAAAKAGLLAYQAAKHRVLQALAIGAAMAFPPSALVTLPAIDYYSEAGETYDMIVGVDGTRVARFIDFEERMRNIRPGELVYLSLVRNGVRIQIPVAIPALSTSASN